MKAVSQVESPIEATGVQATWDKDVSSLSSSVA